MSTDKHSRTSATEVKAQESGGSKGPREKSFLRSLIFLFVIVAIAATVADFRSEHVVDDDKAAFVSQAEQAIDAVKADLWLGGMAAESLTEQGDWNRLNDYARSTLDDVVNKLLGTTAVVYDWSGLKMEEIDRLWKAWEAAPQGDLNTYLADAVAALVAAQELPGLEGGLWLAVTPDGGRYILASVGEQWAICPEEALR
ncbi:MAG: hypothetical protein IKU58_03475 [Clostridia bacterium]|nr:hypothetical protein [Clostridia bacterium]